MAMIRRLRLACGDTIIETKSDGARRMHVVHKRLRGAYVLKCNEEADERVWSDDELWERYQASALEHFAADLTRLDAKLVALIEAGFESWPENLQFRARCKEQFCLYVDRMHKRGVRLMAAYARAARTVFRRNGAEWLIQANRLDAVVRQDRRRRARKATDVTKEDATIRLEQPSLYAVRDWYQKWTAAGKVVDVLIDQYHRRGDFRPKKISKVHLQTDDTRPLCVYGAMKLIAKTVYMQMPRVPVLQAYRDLVAKCEELKIECVTEPTFYAFIRKHFTEYEEYKARHGWKAAYYRFKLFRRREAPTILLEEVEVDHTLLDVVVKDAKGRVGRPWLTLLICRATRCIVGIHIGFDVPSYATLQRAMIHAICPKDLTGLGLKNDWRCCGVPSAVITDRGLEFLSESFKTAGRRIGFAVVNLPGRCPHLKGAVERFFGTLNIRVLSLIDGTTISRTPQFYDPHAEARYSLAELTLRIVRWIVDDYHQEPHDAIGCTPAERWDQLEAEQGIPPVPAFRRLVTLMGERVTRTVQNIGIEWEGHTYRSDELEELRRKRGGREKAWEIRCDPYDRGEVWVLDDTIRTPRWIVVPAQHQRTSRGITRFQARTHLRVARQLLPAGEALTDEIMEEAIRIADQHAADGTGRQVLRYLADGALSTRVIGGIGIATILGVAPEAPVEPEVGPDTDPQPVGTATEAATKLPSSDQVSPPVTTNAERVKSLVASLM